MKTILSIQGNNLEAELLPTIEEDNKVGIKEKYDLFQTFEGGKQTLDTESHEGRYLSSRHVGQLITWAQPRKTITVIHGDIRYRLPYTDLKYLNL